MPIASEAALCNLALGRAGVSQRIADLNDATAAAQACNTYYAPMRDELLAEHPWKFAMRRQLLVPYSGSAWSAATPYGLGDLISYGPWVFRSLTAANLNHSPPSSPASWFQVTRDGWDYACALPTDYLELHEVYPKPQITNGASTSNFSRDSSFNIRNPRSEQRTPYTIEDAQDGTGLSVMLTDLDQPVVLYTAQVTNTQSFSTAFIKALSYILAPSLCAFLTSDPVKVKALEELAVIKKREAIAQELRFSSQADAEPISEYEAARE